MTEQERYADLKSRVGTLKGTEQLWEGRRESHEELRKALAAELTALGIDPTDLEKARVELESRVKEKLDALEAEVKASEVNFDKLRSNNEQQN